MKGFLGSKVSMKLILAIACAFSLMTCTPKKEKWIFILAGQSNMAGRGVVEPQDTITDPRIFTINDSMKVALAKEPLHFYEPTLAGVGSGFSFAKNLIGQLPKNVEIVLVPCAVGGSSIDQWVNDSAHRKVKLYSNFKKRVAFAKTLGTVKAILWHQGESDANHRSLPHYQNALDMLFQNFRTDVGNEKLPILVGELGEYAEPEEKNNNWKALNKILHDIADKDHNVFVVSSEGLTSNPDKVHFNTESQRELGKRFAEEYIKILK